MAFTAAFTAVLDVARALAAVFCAAFATGVGDLAVFELAAFGLADFGEAVFGADLAAVADLVSFFTAAFMAGLAGAEALRAGAGFASAFDGLAFFVGALAADLAGFGACLAGAFLAVAFFAVEAGLEAAILLCDLRAAAGLAVAFALFFPDFSAGLVAIVLSM